MADLLPVDPFGSGLSVVPLKRSMGVSADDVKLVVDNVEYSGWQSIRITRSMDAVAGAFELSLTDVWKPGMVPWPIVIGDAATVKIGHDVVITGWVDYVRAKVSSEEHSFEVKGRDKTSDVVDCSATNRPGEWRNKRIEAIAADICKPFGVKVVCDVDTGAPISLFRLQPGEKAMDALERLTKGGGGMLLLTGTAAGGVLITTASKLQTAPSKGGVSLVEGVNILEIEHEMDGTELFSEYIVEAHAKDSKDGDDGSDPQGGGTLTR